MVDPKPWPELQSILPKHARGELQKLEQSVRKYGWQGVGIYWTDENSDNWIIDKTHASEFALKCGFVPEWRHCGARGWWIPGR